MILETFTDTWNFTFLIVATISILIGSIITIRKMKKESLHQRQEKRQLTNELDDTITVDTLIKKKDNKNINS